MHWDFVNTYMENKYYRFSLGPVPPAGKYQLIFKNLFSPGFAILTYLWLCISINILIIILLSPFSPFIFYTAGWMTGKDIGPLDV